MRDHKLFKVTIVVAAACVALLGLSISVYAEGVNDQQESVEAIVLVDGEYSDSEETVTDEKLEVVLGQAGDIDLSVEQDKDALIAETDEISENLVRNVSAVIEEDNEGADNTVDAEVVDEKLNDVDTAFESPVDKESLFQSENETVVFEEEETVEALPIKPMMKSAMLQTMSIKAGSTTTSTAPETTEKKTETVSTPTATSETQKKTGWDELYVNGKHVGTIYRDSNGNPISGQKRIDDYWYFFDPETGIMAKNEFIDLDWITNPNGGPKTCYYDAQGHLLYKQQRIQGSWYMFRPGTGAMIASDFYNHDSNTNPNGGPKTCYYDAEGRLQYNQKRIGNYWYMFRPGTGAMVESDFFKHDSNTNPNGGAKTCYYDAEGRLQYNQKRIENYWYMFRPGTGAMVESDFFKHDSNTNPNGGAKTCYYDAQGRLQYNQKRIGDYWYMFRPGTGAMVESEFFSHDSNTNPNGGAKTCYYDAQGHMLYGIHEIGGRTWFLESGTGALITKSTLKALEVMRSWLGYNMDDGSHHEIIDLYNSVYPLPVNYRVKYYDDWCDTCVSAAGIKAGISGIIGRECGVERHIGIFKNLGIWIEDGTITPKPGYIITFSWGARSQPNDGFGDHIAYVERVSNGKITIIEGNHDRQVMRRVFDVGDPDIRGYAAPSDVI